MQYNWESKGSVSDSTATLYTFIRERLPTALETKLAEFPAVLMATHGKDITISASPSQEPSRSNTPAIPGSAATETLPTAHKDTGLKAKGKQANTTTLTVDASFMASADDLFSMLTDEKRIPQWSRNSAMVGFSLALLLVPYAFCTSRIQQRALRMLSSEAM